MLYVYFGNSQFCKKKAQYQFYFVRNCHSCLCLHLKLQVLKRAKYLFCLILLFLCNMENEVNRVIKTLHHQESKVWPAWNNSVFEILPSKSKNQENCFWKYGTLSLIFLLQFYVSKFSPFMHVVKCPNVL